MNATTTHPDASPPRPVSAALAKEVRGELQRNGIVVWLDKDSAYSRFVDDLKAQRAAGTFPFDVVGFRGSFLELLFELEPFGSGLDKQKLLVHMPGFNRDQIRKTPVLELYEAGKEFRKGLDTLIREAATGRAAPAEVERFVAGQPSLEAADTWLTAAASRRAPGLAGVLEAAGPKLLVEALASATSSLAVQVTGPEELAGLLGYLHTLTGMDAAWIASFRPAGPVETFEHIRGPLAAWLLCVEYVNDLRRAPSHENLRRLKALSAPLTKACCDLVGQLRREDGDAYERIADEIEAFVAEEMATMTADDLGQVDTFREEENRVLRGAVEALRSGAWAKAKAWCAVRQGEGSFWLQRDQLRRWAWTLVDEAADFGLALARHPRPFDGARDLEHATELYAAGAFEVDRAHRRFEQKRMALLEPRLPHFGLLQEVVGALRRSHRTWADEAACGFAGLCKAQGFLPPAALQQRTLFEQVVHPLVSTRPNERVAVFAIDAFRFEMATELVDELKGPGTIVDLKPRLAELPTITAIGMNVLAPVAQGGRVSIAGPFQGFKAGEFTVRRPEDRARSMGLRSVGKPALLLKLADICDATTAALTKRVEAHALILVHSKEIDDAGEANVGLPTFESTLRQIKAAWHHLQLAGVKTFVFTADHGYLLQDETTEVRPFGTKRDPQRRHVVDDHPRAEAGMVNVSMASLGYDGIPGYLLFREDTAVFATGNPGASFVHGGNSPQERIIPVLTVTRKQVEAGSLSEYAVEVEPLPDVVGLHRLRLRVVFPRGTTTSLGFVAARAVDLALRVPSRENVRVVIKDVSGEGKLKTGRLQVPVVDGWTEVFFGLEGPTDERVRIEVCAADNVEKVRTAAPDQWYAVSGSERPRPAVVTSAEQGWADAIADDGLRKVFLHIEKHTLITETEVTSMLGSPRAFRRFSLEFDQHVALLPFKVRVENGENGKRYVKEGSH